MTAQFPTALVTTTNIPNANPATSLSANNHSGKHDDMRDEIIALETKVGINGSVVTTTHDYKLSGVTGSDKAVGATQTVTVTNKTLGSGTKMGLGSDATGDTYYNSGSGTVSRLGIGSSGQALLSNGSTPYWGSPSSTNTNYASDTGAANAYVVTLSPVPGAYTAGMLVQFKASNANTTTSTVNVNSLGAKTIKKLGGSTDLASGDIASGMIVELEYDGTNFIMLNPVANAPLTATGDGSQLTGIVASGTATASISGTGISTTQNIDTVVTTTFTPKIITVNFWLKGFSGAGSATYSMGTAYFDGTTIKSVYSPLNQSTSTTISATTYTVFNTSPQAGDAGASNGTWTMSIQSLSSTGFTFRLTYTQGSTFNGGDYKATVMCTR